MALKIDDLPDEPASSPTPAPSPSAIRIDELPDEPDPQASPSPQPQGGPIKIDDIPEEEGEITYQDAKDALKRTAMGAAAVLEPLLIPLRVAAGLTAKAIPGAEEALNPGGKVLDLKSEYPFVQAPEVTFTDVSLYLFDRYKGSDHEVLEHFMSKGWDAQTAPYLLLAYKSIPAYAVGTLADFVLDPLQVARVGQANKATRAALAEGKSVSKIERNLLELRAPFTDASLEIPAKPVTDAVGGAASKAWGVTRKLGDKIPGGEKALDTVEEAATRLKSAFDWRTGDLEIDQGATELAGVKRGIPLATNEEFYVPYMQRGFSATEDQLITQVEESVPNLRPNLKIERELAPAEQSALGVDELTLRQHADQKLRAIAKQEGRELDPRRAELIVDQVVDNKRMSSQVLELRAQAGKLDLNQDLATQVIENYYTHKADPRAVRKLRKVDKGMAAVYEQEQLLTKEAEQAIRAGKLTAHDPGGMRRKFSRGQTVFEANAEMEARTGIKQFFIENSTIAGIMRLNEAKNLVANRKFIDLLETKGFKFVERKRLNGSWERRFEGPRGAEHLADKVSYWFVPRETSNVVAAINAYNRVFRSTVLARPDYYFQNWLEGWLKNYAQGVKLSDYVDASKAMAGKGFIEIGGKQVPAAQVRKMLQDLGIANNGSTAEIFQQTMHMAKKLAAEGEIIKGQGRLKQLYKATQEFGARGENWVREAMFINRLKQGWNPKTAAFDIEKFHFDFTRTTKWMDRARLFMPFIQAPTKTLMVAPELIGMNPRAYNFFQIQFMNAIERAFNDPVDASAIYELVPEWRKFQDPIVGPTLSNLLGGNSWIAAILLNQKYVNTQGLPQDQIFFKLPIGMDILSPFMAWEQQIARQGVLSGPIPSALATLMFGLDPFSGKSVDISKDSIEWSRRFKEAGKSLVLTGLGFPNTIKAIQQWYKLPDPEYFTPYALLALNGTMGKFYAVDNVDREFLVRMTVLDRARRDLYKQFISTVINEWKGRTTAVTAASQGLLQVSDAIETKTSRDVFNAFLNNGRQTARTAAARNWLSNRDPKDVVEVIRGINQAVKELNENYVAIRQAILLEKAAGRTDQEIEEAGKSSFGVSDKED